MKNKRHLGLLVAAICSAAIGCKKEPELGQPIFIKDIGSASNYIEHESLKVLNSDPLSFAVPPATDEERCLVRIVRSTNGLFGLDFRDSTNEEWHTAHVIWEADEKAVIRMACIMIGEIRRNRAGIPSPQLRSIPEHTVYREFCK